MAQCICRYLAYALSLSSFQEMMAERKLGFIYSTLYRCVLRLAPPWLDEAFSSSQTVRGTTVATERNFYQNNSPAEIPLAGNALCRTDYQLSINRCRCGSAFIA